ncbi:DUF748 domain-containing protein [Agarivorans sp. QJM3NY_25]|uniref:DUF748 domain-containing protein n=1 Tax=Agarivorans sp. QJM3NY_25 TaxID=3421430 RepID=UPI003D7DF71B
MSLVGWIKLLKKRWQTLRPWQKITSYLALTFISYLLLSLTFLPWLLKQQIESQLSRSSGHPVSVQALSYHPLKLALTLRQFSLAELAVQPSQPLLGFERLYIDFSLSSLFYWRWQFDKVELDGLFVHLSRLQDGRLNIDSLFATAAEPEIEPTDISGRSLPRFGFGKFLLRDASLRISDYLPEQAVDFDISEVSLSLQNFYSQKTGAGVNAYQVNAQIGDKGRLTWNGYVDLPASQISGDVSLENFQLANAFAFARPYTDLRITQGNLQLSTQYLIDYQDDFQLTTEQGQLLIDTLSLQALQQTRSHLAQLKLKGIALDLRQRQLGLGDIQISDGMFKGMLDQQAHLDWLSWFHFDRLLAEMSGAAEVEPARSISNAPEAAVKPWEVSFSSVSLQQFALNIDEQWQAESKNHLLLLQQLQLGAFSSAMNQTTDVRLAAQLYGESPIRAELQFQGPKQKLNGQLSIANLSIAELQKWYSPWLHLPSAKGKLAFSSRLSIDLNDFMSFTSQQGRLELSELRVLNSPHDGAKAWIIWPTLQVEDIGVDLATRQVQIDRVNSEGLNLSMNVDQDGHFDVLEQLLVTQTSSQSSPHLEPAAILRDKASDDGSQPDWQVRIKQVHAQNSQLALSEVFSGQALSHHWQIKSLNVGPLDSSLAQPVNVSAALSAQQGGKVQLQGLVQLAEQQAQLDVTLDALALNHYQPYIAQYSELELISAKLSSHLQLSLNWQQAFALAMQGELGVDDLQLQDARTQSELLKWNQLKLSHLEFNSAERRLALGELSFIKPYFLVDIDEDFSTNLNGLIKPIEAAEPAKVARHRSTESSVSEEPDDWRVSIEKTEFSDGLVNFTDRSLKPNFSADIEQVSGHIGQLSQAPGMAAEVALSGQVDGYAPVNFVGKVAPLATEPTFDAELDFKHLELTRLSAYSGTYAGYVIERGQLSLSLAYQMEKNRLQGNNQIYIEQLQLGKRTDSEKATSLPVSLAIALLEDDQGVIDLGLKVSGDVNDPEFNVAGLVFKALGGALTKIVTSPFAIIGSLVGSDETLNHFSFAAGSSQLSESQTQQLAQLVKGLNKRPHLKIALTGTVEKAQDVPALKRQQLASLLIEASGLTLPIEQVNLSSVLEDTRLRSALVNLAQQNIEESRRELDRQTLSQSLKEQQQLSPEHLNQQLHSLWYQYLVQKMTVSEAQLETLAEHRAITVKDALTKQYQLPNERAFVQRQTLDKQPSAMIVTLSVIAD